MSSTRETLAGQDRFADKEVGCLEDDAVGRDEAARREQHDVAGDNFLDGNRDRLSITNSGRSGLDLRLQRREVHLCAVLA